jgi:hypothetical protein
MQAQLTETLLARIPLRVAAIEPKVSDADQKDG